MCPSCSPAPLCVVGSTGVAVVRLHKQLRPAWWHEEWELRPRCCDVQEAAATSATESGGAQQGRRGTYRCRRSRCRRSRWCRTRSIAPPLYDPVHEGERERVNCARARELRVNLLGTCSSWPSGTCFEHINPQRLVGAARMAGFGLLPPRQPLCLHQTLAAGRSPCLQCPSRNVAEGPEAVPIQLNAPATWRRARWFRIPRSSGCQTPAQHDMGGMREAADGWQGGVTHLRCQSAVAW